MRLEEKIVEGLGIVMGIFVPGKGRRWDLSINKYLRRYGDMEYHVICR